MPQEGHFKVVCHNHYDITHTIFAFTGNQHFHSNKVLRYKSQRNTNKIDNWLNETLNCCTKLVDTLTIVT